MIHLPSKTNPFSFIHMKNFKVSGLLLFALALAACSSGKSDGSGNQNYTASEHILGKLTPQDEFVQHQPEAEKQLQDWQNECAGVDGYRIPNFKPGMRIQSRQDDISVWPDLKPTGEGKFLSQSVESVVSAKEFYSVDTQNSRNYSITARSRHSAGTGFWNSEMVSILSTNPPGLKAQIEKMRGQNDENTTSCRSIPDTNSKFDRGVTFAKFTLSNGLTVNGIVVRETMRFSTYTCGLYRKDRSLIREEQLSAGGITQRVEFYSRDVVNPFRARCHDNPSLLSIFTVRDLASGKIISLNKDEVLAF